jgi:hypothetical protein
MQIGVTCLETCIFYTGVPIAQTLLSLSLLSITSERRFLELFDEIPPGTSLYPETICGRNAWVIRSAAARVAMATSS